jgi:Mrp family chromosome partitioning ATPase
MEKIQAAIAKARAAREGAEPAVPPPTLPQAVPETLVPTSPEPVEPVPSRPQPTVGDTSSEAIWLALPDFTPKPRQLQRSRIVSFEGGSEALPFDVIRTRMLQQMRANGWRRVAITSPGAGSGKSVLALNLAFSLARQPDQRTILIETDLRQPSLARYLGLKARHDVSRVLEGNAPFSDHAVRYGTTLAIATQTKRLRAPAELLQSPGAAAALSTIAQSYAPTVMLFDMPPLQAGDDVMAFVSNVDAVLIVAAAEMTTIKQIDQCERELAAQTNVMGVVLNKCRHSDELAQYGYGY